MVSAVDGAGKEHCHGCWRSSDVAAVDGECVCRYVCMFYMYVCMFCMYVCMYD